MTGLSWVCFSQGGTLVTPQKPPRKRSMPHLAGIKVREGYGVGAALGVNGAVGASFRVSKEEKQSTLSVDKSEANWSCRSLQMLAPPLAGRRPGPPIGCRSFHDRESPTFCRRAAMTGPLPRPGAPPHLGHRSLSTYCAARSRFRGLCLYT
jgi:hypothetical protein